MILKKHIAAIGLGSNLNRPLQQLRTAWKVLSCHPDMRVFRTSRIYQSPPLLPPHYEPAWANKPYLNAVVQIKTSLEPLDLLRALKKIEADLGRVSGEKWAPRVIDLDIVCYDDLVLNHPELILPHPELQNRAFVWVPLADIAPLDLPLRVDLASPQSRLQLIQLPHLLDGPEIVGILNVTPDSFSDGGQFIDGDAALQQAELLFQNGADIIDIGAESTRPNATLIDVDMEWQRLEPILKAIQTAWKNNENRPLISLDTRHASIVERALPYGIDWINDVSQGDFEAMQPLLQNSALKYVAMHHLGVPPKPNLFLQSCPINDLIAFQQYWKERFSKAHLKQNQLILDPGIGFGKTPEQQLFIIKNFEELKKSGNSPWMIGHSRKSFLIKLIPEINNLDSATAFLSLGLESQGIDYLRLHDPEPSLSAIKLQKKQKTFYKSKYFV